MFARLFALTILLFGPKLWADPIKLLVIGDSMSEEYANEVLFSAPDSSPLTANTLNWVEILDALRPSAIDFGNTAAFPDLRGLGFTCNWGFPGATAGFWESVLSSDLLHNPGYLSSKVNLLGQLNGVDAAIVFVGGNDVNANYGNYYKGIPSPAFEENYLGALAFILSTLRATRDDLPILLVNVPDVGATPEVQDDHPDPVQRSVATTHIAALNEELRVLAATYGAVVAELFKLTTSIADSDVYTIGPVRMIPSADRENRPNFMFCKARFHPASGVSAKIANTILAGLNDLLALAIDPLTDDEIAGEVLGLRAYLDWIETFPGAQSDLLADDDGDGLANLAEFALQFDPLVRNPPPTASAEGGSLRLTYPSRSAAPDIVEVIPEESVDLETWTPVSPLRLRVISEQATALEFDSTSPPFIRYAFPLAP